MVERQSLVIKKKKCISFVLQLLCWLFVATSLLRREIATVSSSV